MGGFPTFVQCTFCKKFGETEADGDVPLDWFFVARPRQANPDEQHEHHVPTFAGVETITTTKHVDRWLLCGEDCLRSMLEIGIGKRPAGSAG